MGQGRAGWVGWVGQGGGWAGAGRGWGGAGRNLPSQDRPSALSTNPEEQRHSYDPAVLKQMSSHLDLQRNNRLLKGVHILMTLTSKRHVNYNLFDADCGLFPHWASVSHVAVNVNAKTQQLMSILLLDIAV